MREFDFLFLKELIFYNDKSSNDSVTPSGVGEEQVELGLEVAGLTILE